MIHSKGAPIMMHDWSWYILTRGLCLTCVQLLTAVVMLAWPISAAEPARLLTWYSQYAQAMAAVLLGVSLIGSLLLEDVLRHTQE